jgi:hypothetical protein
VIFNLTLKEMTMANAIEQVGSMNGILGGSRQKALDIAKAFMNRENESAGAKQTDPMQALGNDPASGVDDPNGVTDPKDLGDSKNILEDKNQNGIPDFIEKMLTPEQLEQMLDMMRNQALGGGGGGSCGGGGGGGPQGVGGAQGGGGGGAQGPGGGGGAQGPGGGGAQGPGGGGGAQGPGNSNAPGAAANSTATLDINGDGKADVQAKGQGAQEYLDTVVKDAAKNPEVARDILAAAKQDQNGMLEIDMTKNLQNGRAGETMVGQKGLGNMDGGKISIDPTRAQNQSQQYNKEVFVHELQHKKGYQHDTEAHVAEMKDIVAQEAGTSDSVKLG